MIAEEFAEVFYSTRPAGFVHITVEENEVIACTINQEALDAWIAAHPDEPEPAEEPDMWDEMAAAIAEGVNAV